MNWGAKMLGLSAGLAIPSTLVFQDISKLTPEMAEAMANLSKKIMPDNDSFENTKDVAYKILKDTGLKKKGVKINFVSEYIIDSLAHIKRVLEKEASPKNFLDARMLENCYETFKKGANAAFCPKANEIIVNADNLYTTVYHEIGHAMNKNGNIFTKGLQNMRFLSPLGVSILAPITLCIGLFHKPDSKQNNQKSNTDKALDFVSNNAGKITMASYVPMLAEEGLASIRGINQAKKYLSKDIIRGLKTNYLIAFGTYAFTALLTSLGVALGVKIANKQKDKSTVENV